MNNREAHENIQKRLFSNDRFYGKCAVVYQNLQLET